MNREPYSEREVANGVWQLSGFHGGGLGVNAVIITSGKHALVIDTLTKPQEARRMAKRVRAWGAEPVALINTHWHTDHTAGNCLYNCPIWGQKSGSRYLRIYWPKWVGRPNEKRAGGLRLKAPDQTFARNTTIEFDGEEIRLIHLPGHTTDSIGVYLPDRKLLIAGDAVMNLPFVWFGNSQDALRSLKKVQKLRPRLIVQGHGPPCHYERLAMDVRYLENIRGAARTARGDGVARRAFLSVPMEEFLTPSRARDLGEPYRGLHYLNLARVWNEMLTTRR